MNRPESSNAKKFIEQLYSESTEYRFPSQAINISNSLNALSDDIYSESQRFIFELIQNADDASLGISNEVHFNSLKGCLVVSHQGNQFTESDVQSLTRVGDSTKKDDSKKTGYKGIGFKSVFGRSERVSIISGEYQFRFDKKKIPDGLPWQIAPIWTEVADLPDYVGNLLNANPFPVSTIIETHESNQLASELLDLINNGQILLFLRNIG